MTTATNFNRYTLIALTAILSAGAGYSEIAQALNLSTTPLYLTNNTAPRLVFTMSRDHELHKKAYTDYSDLDGNGTLEITYTDTYDYYGYFDPRKCYVYQSSRFEPTASASGTNLHHCNASATDQWSGNFLNWVAMTRIDILRKVLYGGLRSTDGDNLTVLERSFIPTDGHAYVKAFDAGTNAALKQYVPHAVAGATSTQLSLCNTSWSTTNANSGGLTADPLIRVARGLWNGWASNEVVQCAFRNEANGGLGIEPDSADKVGDYIARVKVCTSASLKESNCNLYDNSAAPHYKPDGLLQKYGEKFHFGLVTGSFGKNLSGGVLRREAEKIMNNSTSAKNEIDKTSGKFTPSATESRIIKTLNLLRAARYNPNLRDYADCDAPGITTINEGNATTGCSDWGNPIAEMYLEALRYYSGQTSPTTAFNSDDSGYISGLTRDTSWTDPLPTAEFCAKSNVVIVSTGNTSFDTNQFSNASDVTGLSDTIVNDRTKAVGDGESITNGTYLIGENGTTNDKQCTGKTITDLSLAKGICPEVPTTEGGYKIAGLAYHARITDLRPAAAYTGTQNVNTFAIALAENIPTFRIPVGTGAVTLMPYCEANSTATATASSTGWRACSMVDLRIEDIKYDTSTPPKPVRGKLLVHWEDSTWGNDYDMDGVERITFCVGSECANYPNSGDSAVSSNDIRIITSAPLAAAGHALLFGYTITGTTSDGVKRLVLRPGGSNFNQLYSPTTNPSNKPADVTTVLTAGTSSAKLLQDPLWYAAKWGGFNDTDGSAATGYNLPDKTSEWDSIKNATGTPGTDGIPDNYFQVNNPAGLESSLNQALSSALEGSATAAAVAVNTASLTSGSFVYQVNFTSQKWSGQIVARQINSSGVVNNSLIENCGSTNPGCPWEAGEKTRLQTSRVIITSNPNLTGAKKGAAFTWSDIGTTNQGLLNGTPSDGFGSQRLSYLRGDHTYEGPQTVATNPSFRIRRDGYELGDIINSAPAFVGQPPFLYPDSLEADKYSEFRNNPPSPSATISATRDPIIYVGANDGMLHGFYACTDTSVSKCGTEAIAYVPSMVYANLPDLTNPAYNHRYYVDGSPTVGDVYGNFGTNCSTGTSTSNCWRTVLIGGLGGGGNGYFALDVTDPTDFSETNASKLVLWEFTDGDLGNTFSKATIAKMKNGVWAAIFGNGYNSASGNATLFIVNAVTGALIREITLKAGGGNGLSTPSIVDVDGNYIADYIYAGDLEGNMWKVDVTDTDPGNWGSYYIKSSNPAPLFIATDGTSPSPGKPQPITSRPSVSKHPDGESGYMVYFGTGKYLEVGDNVPKSSPIQSFYGIWDKNSGGTVSGSGVNAAVARGTLLQQTITESTSGSGFPYRTVTDTNIQWDGVSYGASPPTTGSHKGWFINMLTTSTANLGEMVVFQPVLRSGRVIFTTLVPEDRPCVAGGFSWLMEVNYRNGGKLPFEVFDINNDNIFDSDDRISGDTVSGIKTNTGISPDVVIIDDPSRGRELKITTGTKGTVESVKNNPGPNVGQGRRSWRQLK